MLFKLIFGYQTVFLSRPRNWWWYPWVDTGSQVDYSERQCTFCKFSETFQCYYKILVILCSLSVIVLGYGNVKRHMAKCNITLLVFVILPRHFSCLLRSRCWYRIKAQIRVIPSAHTFLAFSDTLGARNRLELIWKGSSPRRPVLNTPQPWLSLTIRPHSLLAFSFFCDNLKSLTHFTFSSLQNSLLIFVLHACVSGQWMHFCLGSEISIIEGIVPKRYIFPSFPVTGVFLTGLLVYFADLLKNFYSRSLFILLHVIISDMWFSWVDAPNNPITKIMDWL